MHHERNWSWPEVSLYFAWSRPDSELAWDRPSTRSAALTHRSRPMMIRPPPRLVGQMGSVAPRRPPPFHPTPRGRSPAQMGAICHVITPGTSIKTASYPTGRGRRAGGQPKATYSAIKTSGLGGFSLSSIVKNKTATKLDDVGTG